MQERETPFPIFPPMADFVRCLNDGLDFPFNRHVIDRLNGIDPPCQAIETCRHAADFLLERMQAKRTPWADRYINYTGVLHLVLNWCFLVDRSPLKDWDNEKFSQFLDFVRDPDDSWISRNHIQPRFIKSSHSMHSQRLINAKWRPVVRPTPGATIVSGVMTRLRGITVQFLEYLQDKGVRAANAPVPKTPVGVQVDSGIAVHNLDVVEMNWLFRHLDLERSKPGYGTLRFLSAIARFTNIPFAALIRGEHHMGLLSQFWRDPDCPEPRRHRSISFYVTRGNQADTFPPSNYYFHWPLSHWNFVENPGAPVEHNHPLPWILVPYLEEYIADLGYELAGELPDTPTLPSEQWTGSLSEDLAYRLFRRLRIEIAGAAGNAIELTASSAAKMRHLTFGSIRRSERACLQATLQIDNLRFNKVDS